MLYHGKEKIHSEIELIVYELKWYSPTSIISLALLVLRPKLVLLLTGVLSELSVSASLSASASQETRRLLYFHDIGVTWYEPLYIYEIYMKNKNIKKTFSICEYFGYKTVNLILSFKTFDIC